MTTRTAVVIAIATALASGLAGGVMSWAVAKAADKTVYLATDDGPIAVEMVLWDDADHVIPGSPDRIDVAELSEATDDLRAYVLAKGGVSTDVGFHIELIVYGTRDFPIIIRDIRAVDVSCETPDEDWTLLTGDHGAGLPPLELALELREGEDNAQGQPMASGAHNRLWQFPRQVSTAEADRFGIYPDAPAGKLCEFAIDLDYSAQGETESALITNSGQQFRIADPGYAGSNAIDLNLLPPPA